MTLERQNSRRPTRGAQVLSDKQDGTFMAELFPPHHPGRRGQGGLRKRGYFKARGGFIQNCEDATTRPLITVITAVFNGANSIERTILSVLNQTYDNVEYLIIDGGSTDETLDTIRKYDDSIDYWVSEPDAGIYHAWNKGTRLASGDWIAFIGAGDTYSVAAIESYVASIRACGGNPPEFISSRVNVTSGSNLLRTIGRPWSWRSFRRFMNVAHVGSLHSRNLFEKRGLFDTSYRICGDYEFLLRSQSSLRAVYLDVVTASLTTGGASDSNPQVFRETVRAKSTTGGRSKLMSEVEFVLAVVKWKLRKWLWY